MTRPLYPIADDLMRLLAKFTDEEEALTDEQFDELMAEIKVVEAEANTKLEGYWIICKQLQAQESMLADEVKRLEKRKKGLTTNRERMLRAIEQHMDKLGLTEMESEHFKFRFKTSESVFVPPTFFEWALTHNPDLIRVTYEPEKIALKKELATKTPDELGGATIVVTRKVAIT